MAEVIASESPSQSSPPPVAPVNFQFTGKASEYFGIWIVNLLLTIVTLGLYSPWAKVRRLKYFHRHTELAGSSFDFHGSPVRILIGRLIALASLLAYNFSVRLHSPITLVLLVVLAVVLPWLLRNSLRFRLYNSSWRGTRFHFRGTAGGAYRVFLLNGFLTLITLYGMAPFMHQRMKAYQHNNTWFGNTQCSFHARVGQFYKVYLLVLGAVITFVAVVVASGVIDAMAAAAHAKQAGAPPNAQALGKTILMLYAVAILFVVSIGPWFRVLITNLIWNNTRIGEHRIECRIQPGRFVWISISNAVAVVFTLGLLMPWASVRMLRYQMSALRFFPATDLQEFTAAEPETVGAIGDEAASVFDFDVAL